MSVGPGANSEQRSASSQGSNGRTATDYLQEKSATCLKWLKIIQDSLRLLEDFRPPQNLTWALLGDRYTLAAKQQPHQHQALHHYADCSPTLSSTNAGQLLQEIQRLRSERQHVRQRLGEAERRAEVAEATASAARKKLDKVTSMCESVNAIVVDGGGERPMTAAASPRKMMIDDDQTPSTTINKRYNFQVSRCFLPASAASTASSTSDKPQLYRDFIRNENWRFVTGRNKSLY